MEDLEPLILLVFLSFFFLKQFNRLQKQLRRNDVTVLWQAGA